MPARPLTPAERRRARIVTGPLGHLWGGTLDWVEAIGTYAWGRVSRRVRRSASGPRRP